MSARIPSSIPSLPIPEQTFDATDSKISSSSSASTHWTQPQGTTASQPHIYRRTARPRGLQIGDRREFSPEEKAIVKQTYRENRYYHGTGYKREIEQAGMDIERKTAGAMKAYEAQQEVDKEFAETTKQHNYFTQNKDLAKFFATFASAGTRPPGLVRALIDKKKMQLECDPDMDEDPAGTYYGAALRTPRSVPSGHLLRSKKGISQPPMEAIKTFREKLAQQNVIVSEMDADRLLWQEQSDSEDDFAGSPNEETR